MENLKCRGDAIAKKINDAMKVKAVLSDRVGKDWCLLSVRVCLGLQEDLRNCYVVQSVFVK